MSLTEYERVRLKICYRNDDFTQSPESYTINYMYGRSLQSVTQLSALDRPSGNNCGRKTQMATRKALGENISNTHTQVTDRGQEETDIADTEPSAMAPR